jgi:hypothetical protein
VLLLLALIVIILGAVLFAALTPAPARYSPADDPQRR